MATQNEVNEFVKDAVVALASLKTAQGSYSLTMTSQAATITNQSYTVNVPYNIFNAQSCTRFFVTNARIKLSAAIDRGVIMTCDSFSLGTKSGYLLTGPNNSDYKNVKPVVYFPALNSTTVQVQVDNMVMTSPINTQSDNKVQFQFMDDLGNNLNNTSTPSIVEWSISFIVYTQ